ncbi:MAG TPA: hypothetical protein VMV46_04550 [Thermoanaerobaculia bacterium]|nr:hypothetical protein [Thermoanaerobaculia bacterium]
MTQQALEPFMVSAIMITLIVSVAGVLRHLLRVRQQRQLAELRLQMQNRVLDRLERPEQLLEYLGSDEGRRWLELDEEATSGAAGRILGSLQVGAVALLVGVTLFFLQGRFSRDEGVAEVLTLVGAVGAATGLGFLVSAAAAFVLGRRWGLLPEGSRRAASGGGE